MPGFLKGMNSEGRENTERILVRIEMYCVLDAQLTNPVAYKERVSSTQYTINNTQTSQTKVIMLLKHLFHFILDNIFIFYSFLPHVFVNMIRLFIMLHILCQCKQFVLYDNRKYDRLSHFIKIRQNKTSNVYFHEPYLRGLPRESLK